MQFHLARSACSSRVRYVCNYNIEQNKLLNRLNEFKIKDCRYIVVCIRLNNMYLTTDFVSDILGRFSSVFHKGRFHDAIQH